MAVWLLIGRGTTESDGVVVPDRQGPVTRVVDGDTLRVRIGGSTERVRLIGIDAPERGECYSTRATQVLQSLTQGTVVRVQGDAMQPPRDRYGRLLAYVVLPDETDVGHVVLERGAAVVFETRPPFARRDAYLEAEAEAKRASAGLHGVCR